MKLFIQTAKCSTYIIGCHSESVLVACIHNQKIVLATVLVVDYKFWYCTSGKKQSKFENEVFGTLLVHFYVPVGGQVITF